MAYKIILRNFFLLPLSLECQRLAFLRKVSIFQSVAGISAFGGFLLLFSSSSSSVAYSGHFSNLPCCHRHCRILLLRRRCSRRRRRHDHYLVVFPFFCRKMIDRNFYSSRLVHNNLKINVIRMMSKLLFIRSVDGFLSSKCTRCMSMFLFFCAYTCRRGLNHRHWDSKAEVFCFCFRNFFNLAQADVWISILFFFIFALCHETAFLVAPFSLACHCVMLPKMKRNILDVWIPSRFTTSLLTFAKQRLQQVWKKKKGGCNAKQYWQVS